LALKTSISGEINDFKGNDGTNRPDWKVVLGKTKFDTDNFDTPSDPQPPDYENGTKATWHIGSKKGSAGNFDVDLYGGGNNKKPTHAAGRFFAHGQTTERIIGAFGATEQ